MNGAGRDRVAHASRVLATAWRRRGLCLKRSRGMALTIIAGDFRISNSRGRFML